MELYGTALELEPFGNVTERGGAGALVASPSGQRLDALTAEQDATLATTTANDQLTFLACNLDRLSDSIIVVT